MRTIIGLGLCALITATGSRPAGAQVRADAGPAAGDRLPPCGRSVANDVNDAGWIVGSVEIHGERSQAVAWVGDSVIRLGALLPGGHSDALAVDERGRVVGVTQGADRREHGFLWEDGRMTDLAPLSRAVGIDGSDRILGERPPPRGQKEAVLWSDGEVRSLGSLDVAEYVEPKAMNARGQVVGGAGVRGERGGGFVHAFLWEEGRMQDLTPGRWHSVALDVSDAGHVVGTLQTAPLEYHAFLWEDGSLRELGTFGGRGAYAMAVNDHGRIVVNVDIREGDPPRLRRALLVDGDEVVDLGRLREDDAETEARAMNGEGVVVGKSGERAFVWQDGVMRKLPSPVACEEPAVGPEAGRPIVPKLPGDVDGDGVGDADDLCPLTPEGATPDPYGCPMDTDDDGVMDGLDRCPDTARGAVVGRDGCVE